MKWCLPLVALMLVGCHSDSSEFVQYDPNAGVARQASIIVQRSVIVCADGNQVRMFSQALGTDATAFSGWTILDENGNPKRCVRKLKNTPEAYEEVPA